MNSVPTVAWFLFLASKYGRAQFNGVYNQPLPINNYPQNHFPVNQFPFNVFADASNGGIPSIQYVQPQRTPTQSPPSIGPSPPDFLHLDVPEYPQCPELESKSCKQEVTTSEASQPFGPYSQAVRVGNTAYISGSGPYDHVEKRVMKNSIEEQADLALRNMKVIAEAAGGGLDKIVKVTLYIVDFNDLGAINKIMENYFSKPYPARTIVGANKLWLDASLEMDAIMELTEN